MFDFEVKTIPANMMRYPSAGDYYEGKNGVIFAICDMRNWKYEALIAIHEIVEYVLIKAANIPIKVIDDFDVQFELEREAGVHGEKDEPGDSPDSPYHIQHGYATCVERCVAAALGVNWTEYSDAVAGIYFPSVKKMWKKRR